MDLIKLDKQLPLRAYPEQDLNKVLLMDFLPWLTRLLSLTDKVSADRLEVALPAIKQQCIGMGFPEIKKMFEMYCDSNLSIKPIPNYFDRILLGKIVSEYKSRQKPKTKEVPMKDNNVDMDKVLMDAYLEFKRSGKLPFMITHIYKYLFDTKKLPQHNKEFTDGILERAKVIAKTEAMEYAQEDYQAHKTLGTLIKKINDGKGLKSICMKIIITDYFKNQ